LRKTLSKIVLFLLLSLTAFSYNFPIEDPYSATIIGSSTMMTEGIMEKIPLKVYEIQIKDKKDIPEIFWYADKFKFSLSKQKNKKAPLIFVLAGTGSDYNAARVKFMQRIFHTAGYHTIAISSQMSQQFIISASSNSAPGLLMEDNKDLYKVMKLAYDKVKDQIEVTDFYIMGYSLGGTNAAFISYLDETDKVFNFKRVKATQEEKIKWLNELNSMLEKPEYFTFFYGLDKKLDLNNEITLNFSGNGCWTYEENIRWFQQDKELIDHMKKMPNLKIKISYKEYEEGEGFISRAKLKLNVTKEKITIKKTTTTTIDQKFKFTTISLNPSKLVSIFNTLSEKR